MKLLQTKLMAALILGVISFGMFSFTTTPIIAQETKSEITVTADNENAALPAALAVAFIKGVVLGAAVGLAYKAYTYLTSSKSVVEDGYPADSLDQ